MVRGLKRILPVAPVLWCVAIVGRALACAAETAPDAPAVVPSLEVQAQPKAAGSSENAKEQVWNWHMQNTDIVQYHPGFHADYSGPNSMHNFNEVKETVSLDLTTGVRLWRGA